jgi:hypothetical protein
MLENCAPKWVRDHPFGVLRKKFVKNLEGLAV